MVLPELSWQFIYARLAWALFLAAVIVSAWPPARRLPRRILGPVVASCFLLMALPGEASPAWGLCLAFQYPSGLLAGFCAARLYARWHGARHTSTSPAAMPTMLAAVLAATGAILYLDAFGLLSRGYYYAGFGPSAAPLLAILLAAVCAVAIARDAGRPQACAVLGAVLLFSLARLPTGNLWDAVLDPLLWAWALASLARRAWRRAMPARGTDRHIFIK